MRRETITAMTWRRFRRSKLALIALAYVGVVAVVALLAPSIAGDPNAIDLASRLRPPDHAQR